MLYVNTKLYGGKRQTVPRADLARIPKLGRVTKPPDRKPLPGQMVPVAVDDDNLGDNVPF